MDLELEPTARAKKPSHRARTARERRPAAPQTTADGLTAADLIAMLEELDPATPIVIEGQYGGFDSARGIARVPLRYNVNSLEGFGPHDRASPGEPPQAIAVAVLVRPEADFAE